MWRWDQTDPFGGNPPDENPSGLGAFTCNLRLPGQYFDKETNLAYNYFRDYGPAEGRYIQSDPIGVAGVLRKQGLLYDDASDAARLIGTFNPERARLRRHSYDYGSMLRPEVVGMKNK